MSYVFMSTCHQEDVECSLSYVFMPTCHQEIVECGMSDVIPQDGASTNANSVVPTVIEKRNTTNYE